MIETQAPPAIEGFRGTLLTPGDDGYDEVRFTWNAMFDKHPALIARCSGVADVIAGVDFARDNGLLLSVRGGGHSVPGHSTCDDGLCSISRRCAASASIPSARTARAEGGVNWGTFDHETQALRARLDRAARSRRPGIAGLTLGGGIGWLMRKHGLACDNLISADVVTADGQLVTASADENAELFWGLRGGGGNFGVVTSFEYRAARGRPLVFGGAVMHPVDSARELCVLPRVLQHRARTS